jgi:tetratricopeptide (TPR) repeat protein
MSSDSLEDQLAQAARLLDEGDAASAFELLLEAERDHPDDGTLLCMLGLTAEQAEAPGMSYDFYRRALAAQPEDPNILALLGAGLAHFDDPDAEGVLRLAAVTAPDLALARFQYGSYLAREGLLELAISELEAARSLDASDPGVTREIGIAHLLAGADALAIEALEDAVALAPEDDDVRVLHALALLRHGSLAEAAEELNATSQVIEGDAEVQLLSALACATQEWDGEAWNSLARAEQGAGPGDAALIREVEDVIEGGPAAAREFLLTQLAPTVLRERLFARR